MRIQDQMLRIEGQDMHSGRRLDHYIRLGILHTESANPIELVYTGRSLHNERTKLCQLFVRTLTGYVEVATSLMYITSILSSN